MAIKINIDEKIKTMHSEEEENAETYGEVDLEEELICALREIKNLRKKNLKQKEQLQKYEEEDDDSKTKCHKSLKK
jgi:hypothetical protein